MLPLSHILRKPRQGNVQAPLTTEDVLGVVQTSLLHSLLSASRVTQSMRQKSLLMGSSWTVVPKYGLLVRITFSLPLCLWHRAFRGLTHSHQNCHLKYLFKNLILISIIVEICYLLQTCQCGKRAEYGITASLVVRW